LFGGEDPIGHQLHLGDSSPVRLATIVGIVGDLRHRRPDVAPAPEVYIHYLQGPPVSPLLTLRTSGDPARMAPAIRSALKDVDPSIVPSNMRTMDELRAATVGDRVFLMALIALFGALALVLAAVGVFGVLSLAVAERRREMGIRLALGASPRGLMALVVRHALVLAVIGAGSGVVVALALSPLFAGQLFEISAADPLTIAGVVVTLLAVAVMAAIAPAVRVMRVDPVSTLRLD
jgi:ABC-type antimicrobial peptide transport system permease subunit